MDNDVTQSEVIEMLKDLAVRCECEFHWHVKWTCPNCGDRVTCLDQDKFYSSYKHEKDGCYFEYKHPTDPSQLLIGYVLIQVLNNPNPSHHARRDFHETWD